MCRADMPRSDGWARGYGGVVEVAGRNEISTQARVCGLMVSLRVYVSYV